MEIEQKYSVIIELDNEEIELLRAYIDALSLSDVREVMGKDAKRLNEILSLIYEGI